MSRVQAGPGGDDLRKVARECPRIPSCPVGDHAVCLEGLETVDDASSKPGPYAWTIALAILAVVAAAAAVIAAFGLWAYRMCCAG